MIFENIKELEEIVKNNDIKKALSFIKKPDFECVNVSSKKRSALMVSGHQVKHLNKIDELPADIIMLNLEDGVPKEKKEIARIMIAVFLTQKPINKEIVVRINPLDEGGFEDIEFLKKYCFNAFRIPKVKSIEKIDDVFFKTDKEIQVSVETKEIFFNLREFDHPKVTIFYLGLYDLFNTLNLPLNIINIENPLIHKILSDFSLNSRYIGKTPIGFVYQQYKDLEEFSKWCILQKNLGLKGVGCITPKQAEIANKIFDEDINFAKTIVDRFEKEGPFTIDGLYVDEPIYKNYLRLLQGL